MRNGSGNRESSSFVRANAGVLPGLRALIAIAILCAAPDLPAQTVQAANATSSSMAQAQAELEQLAAQLPMTLDMSGAATPLRIDPYADQDPVEVWNDWRMQNKRDREPPLLVVTAHTMWANLHGLTGDTSKDLASRWVVPVPDEMTGERLAAALNIAPAAPVPGEEAEVFLSVDPGNPLHIVGSSNHRLLGDASCTSALSTSGVTLNSNGGQELTWSTDGGATWSRLCAPWHGGSAYTLTTANGTSPFTFQSSDPSIAWDTSGNAYVFTLPWWQDASGSFSGNSVNVVKWTAATNTWSAIATPQSYVNCTSTTCDTMDKTEGAIDTSSGQAFSHTNRMYFAWTRLFLQTLTWRYRMRIAYSDPPYTTWTISDFAPGGTTEQGNGVTRLSSSMVVAADGTVYLAWDRNLTTGSTQRISKSTDGGVTWSAGVTMSSTSTLTDFGASTKIAAQDTRGIALLPQIAVDACTTSPYIGRLYESYTDFHTGVTSGNDVDVYVRRSTDGGATWSTVATFTGVAAGTSQFEPITTVDPSTGTVTVAWYDTSVDPTLNRRVQVYASQSADGGTTWSAQQLMTDSGANFSHHLAYLDENSTDMPNVTTLHHYQYGEYMGASSSGGNLWVGWTDSRNWLTETPGDTEYEDVGLYVPCTPPDAPVLTSVSVPQDNRLDVAWNDSAAASTVQYVVLRATVSGGPYAPVATVPDGSPGVGGGPSYVYHDDTVSGGTTYYYVVTASNGTCASSNSNEGSALATGQCLLPPAFAGLQSVANAGSPTCTLNLSWSAGTSNCSGSVTYNVYRSTSSVFAPSPANRIATGVSGTSYADTTGVASGTTYYYIVRAVDGGNGVEDANTVRKSGAPTGPVTTQSFTDTFEGSQSGGGFDLAGWSTGTISGSTNWAWSTAQANDGTHSWFASDVVGPDDKVLVSPSFLVIPATTLSFRHTYAFEGTTTTCYDAGTLESTVDGGASWIVVPAGDFTAGAYTGTANAGFSNPIGGKAAWCAGTIGAMTQVAANLGGDANLVNKTVQLRWHEGDDSSVAATGWYVDTVSVANAGIAGTCTTGSACTAPGAPSLTSATGGCSGVTLLWTAGTGTTSSYDVYRAIAPGGPYTKLPGMPVAATTYLDTTGVEGTPYYYVVTGACDAGGTTESGISNEATGAKSASGSACDDGNACTTNDACSGGACAGGPALDCGDGNPCTDDSCLPATGCAHQNNTAPCSDGSACTSGDACSGGACAPGAPTVCNDGNVCTTDTCNPLTGCVFTNNDTPCDDGNACTQGDKCDAGSCSPGSPIACNDGNVCTNDTCNSASGCVFTNNTAPCDDGNACTTGDVCGNGVCNPGAAVVCNDNNACTTDACAPASGCVFTNNANPCDDGNACTIGDACGNGVCNPGAAVVCNDANVCTTDTCNPATGCVFANNTAACDDGNACTLGDRCAGGVCGPGGGAPAESIANGGFEAGTGGTGCGANPFQRTAWVGTGSALQHSGCGWTGPDVSVSLGEPDGVTQGTISQSFAATTGPGTLSYQQGSYAPGSCSYTVTFGPSNTVVAVTNAALSPGLANASPVPVPAGTTSVTFGGVDCSVSGLALVQFDNVSLMAGGAALLDCNDGNPCTSDGCNPASGCVHTNNTVSCDDGSACTTGDVCDNGVCAGVAITCNDANVCTTDTCNPASGCVFTNNTSACDDGNPCTVGDTCGGGVCNGGTTITAPPETQAVAAAADKSTYSWAPATFATRYDVVRGSVGAFPVGPGGGDETCFDNLGGPTLVDPVAPAPGGGFWYLSRGENACGIGTYGNRSNGSPRVTTTCP